jgi:uncharacterized membrane protein YgcG
MSNPRIEVDVVANVAGVASGVSDATSQLDKLGKAAQATSPKIEALTKTTSRYNAVGIDFARVIQDAPFGIIGVGNNIQQLAQSFSGLGKAGDTVGSKIKLAFSQIFSSGNALILGVSILTTVFTILQQKGFFKTEEAAKSLNEQLEDYRETLDGITKATLEGAISAQKEISSLKLLQVQAENTNLSIEKRLAAVNDLKKQFPEYLQNLTDEQILTGNVGEAYKSLTTDILSLAKAKAFSAQIDKNTSNSLTLLLQEEERAIQILQKRADLQSLVAQKGRGEQGGQFVAGQDVGVAGQIRDITKEIDELTKETVKSAQERSKLAEQNLKLEAGITDFSSQGASFAKIKTEETKELKRTFEEIQKIKFDKLNISFDIPKESFGFVNVDTIKKEILALDALETRLQGTGISVGEFYYAIANGAAEGFDNLDTFIGRISDTRILLQNTFDLLQANVTDAFTDLGASLGEALASGTSVISSIGRSLLSSVGKLLGDFGKQLIAFGVAGLAYSKLIQSIFTDPITAAPKAGLAIAAGIALVAISGAIGSSMKKNSGGGGGGGGGGGSSVGTSGVGGGTSFAGGGQGGLFQQNKDLNGELVVRGQDLVYVFAQANNKINKG